MKTTMIMLLAAFFVVAGAYWTGGRIGMEKCRAEMANAANANIIATQNEIIKIKGEINAETFNTGVSDIRQQLRKNWTIRD